MTTANPQTDILSWAGSKDGEFKRLPSSFRNSITADGEYKPEKGRYILYVSLACPWAHRTLIVRKLKQLEPFIDVSIVHPFMGALGWSFYPPIKSEDGEHLPTKGEVAAKDSDGLAEVTLDPLHDYKFIRELYFSVNPKYEGRFTVPVLWDKKTSSIVNNESAEIIRMMYRNFDEFLPADSPGRALDLLPKELEKDIDTLQEWVYDTVNNGVYKSGFASKPAAYQTNVVKLFESLDRLEKLLEGKTFLIGDVLTEADVRLFTTIIRFDPVYVGHFKCNIGTIRHNYPAINKWQKNLYWNYPAFKDTTNFDHIKQHYYSSHAQINPTRIVPRGPLPHIEPL